MLIVYDSYIFLFMRITFEKSLVWGGGGKLPFFTIFVQIFNFP